MFERTRSALRPALCSKEVAITYKKQHLGIQRDRYGLSLSIYDRTYISEEGEGTRIPLLTKCNVSVMKRTEMERKKEKYW